jgi:hypothetical protein
MASSSVDKLADGMAGVALEPVVKPELFEKLVSFMNAQTASSRIGERAYVVLYTGVKGTDTFCHDKGLPCNAMQIVCLDENFAQWSDEFEGVSTSPFDCIVVYYLGEFNYIKGINQILKSDELHPTAKAIVYICPFEGWKAGKLGTPLRV